jgi:DNA-binding SARP family transcriptional activator/Tfp pilus assembly protein PilF
VQVRLLGPVDVLADGTVRQVHGLRRKAVLAALALQPGEIVSVDKLIDITWDGQAPATAAAALQNMVSHLRRVLGDKAAILAHPPGYVLGSGEPTDEVQATDVLAARRLIGRAAQSTDLGERQALLEEALALWRGQPVVELAGLAWFDQQAQRLEELWLQVHQTLTETRLALGQHAQLIPELEALSGRYPHDENTRRQLMLALYRAGRQGDALAAYQRLRHSLREDLAIAPSPPLRELEAAILRQDPALDPTLPPPPTAGPVLDKLVPAQLPSALATFTGRGRELARLDSLLTGNGGGPAQPATVVISAISGTAGIGKTTLAVHWAHRVASWFPDGQLYVDLRGFDPSGQAVDPAEAVRGFLEVLGVAPDQIPTGVDAQIGLYRSLLAGRRILVLLDNARDAEQVRPLLPGTPGCLAVVTSRNQPSPLVATGGAHLLTLDLLSTVEARDLIARRIGAERVAAEPDAVEQIIAGCARLPLALAVVAARAAAHPDFPLATLAAELGDTTGALNALRGGDAVTDVRAVFAWSYRLLGSDAARLFRLLGLHPGPDIGAPAAASLAGLPPEQARTLLAELAREHLVTEHTPGRYTCHDLLRGYAAERAHAHDSPDARHAAMERTLDHYLHTGYAAAMLINPDRDPIELGPPKTGVWAESLGDRDHALAWFSAERPVLLAAVQLAAASGFDNHTWKLASALGTFLLRHGHWAEHITIQHTALEATRRLDDRAAEAHIKHGIALGYFRLGRLDDAESEYRQVLEQYAELDDPNRLAAVNVGLAAVTDKQGRLDDSITHNRRALDLYRMTGDRVGQANALNNLGWHSALLGDYRQSVTYCTQALNMLQDLGHSFEVAGVWDSLGYAHRGLADYDQAVACYQHAADHYRDLGDRYYEADAFGNLGDTHDAAGNFDAARKAWHQALDILDSLGHPDAERIRDKLRR